VVMLMMVRYNKLNVYYERRLILRREWKGYSGSVKEYLQESKEWISDWHLTLVTLPVTYFDPISYLECTWVNVQSIHPLPSFPPFFLPTTNTQSLPLYLLPSPFMKLIHLSIFSYRSIQKLLYFTSTNIF